MQTVKTSWHPNIAIAEPTSGVTVHTPGVAFCSWTPQTVRFGSWFDYRLRRKARTDHSDHAEYDAGVGQRETVLWPPHAPGTFRPIVDQHVAPEARELLAQHRTDEQRDELQADLPGRQMIDLPKQL